MALFSDIDWIIIAGVGAFLFLGKENGAWLRTLGKYYGRLLRMKQDLLADVARSADLPIPAAGQPMSLRTAFVQMADPAPGRTSGIPIHVSAPPVAVASAALVAGGTGLGVGPETWSLALPPGGTPTQVVIR